MSQQFDVCIRGGGVVGRTLALLLARERLKVALVAPPVEPGHEDVRAYAINSTSRSLLESLRAWPEEPFTTPVRDIQVWGGGDNAVGAQLDFSAQSTAQPALAWIVDVPALEQRLVEAVRFQSHIDVVQAPVKAALQVVCEGQKSTSRNEFGASWTVKPYGQSAVAARLTSSQGHHGVARQWFQNGDILALLPMSGADGHTLAFPSILSVTNPALMTNYPYDMARDFEAVTVVGFIPHALAVRSDFPVKTLAELVALAKDKPGTLAYGSSGNGTSAHLAGAMFAQMAGLNVTHVPYRGAALAMQDLLSGHVQFMFLDMSTGLAHIRTSKLRALAMAPARRVAVLPDVPSIAEQGYPSYNIRAWYGLLAKAGTPPEIIQKLYAEVKRALDSPEVREIFLTQGIVPGGMPPAEFATLIKEDLAHWKRTIESLNLKQP